MKQYQIYFRANELMAWARVEAVFTDPNEVWAGMMEGRMRGFQAKVESSLRGHQVAREQVVSHG